MSDQPDNSEPDARKPPDDPNEFGKWLVDLATGESPEADKPRRDRM